MTASVPLVLRIAYGETINAEEFFRIFSGIGLQLHEAGLAIVVTSFSTEIIAAAGTTADNAKGPKKTGRVAVIVGSIIGAAGGIAGGAKEGAIEHLGEIVVDKILDTAREVLGPKKCDDKASSPLPRGIIIHEEHRKVTVTPEGGIVIEESSRDVRTEND